MLGIVMYWKIVNVKFKKKYYVIAKINMSNKRDLLIYFRRISSVVLKEESVNYIFIIF